MRLNVQGLYDKIIITIVPSYTGKKKITCLLPLALLLVLRTHNNTDSNKLVIFSSIALCYGDIILYSAKFSRVFNFTNFVNFKPFVKIFQRKVLTHGAQCAHAVNSRNYFNKIFKNRYLRKFRPSKI